MWFTGIFHLDEQTCAVCVRASNELKYLVLLMHIIENWHFYLFLNGCSPVCGFYSDDQREVGNSGCFKNFFFYVRIKIYKILKNQN